ncbi:RNA-binding protein pno1-like isoform X1 [Hibiscus syriacus]|uniref:RNA-binding protein pno1-like isoform X1 n=1 Tax=Hibiscus syriacus TaxID=106335 RepID=A0A6A3CKP3_HIBSY|nr:RNA-binding protein pno1-like isoform X1 [Hibiscus syriacus]
MSGKASSPKVELKLELSPPTPGAANQPAAVLSPNASVSSSEMSSGGSCMSSEPPGGPNSYEGTPMMLVGCPRCLMYVMLSEVDPKCPKCKSTVLLDFLNQDYSKK